MLIILAENSTPDDLTSTLINPLTLLYEIPQFIEVFPLLHYTAIQISRSERLKKKMNVEAFPTEWDLGSTASIFGPEL